MKQWTSKQWKAYHNLSEWSHQVSTEGAAKLLEHAGTPQNTLTCIHVFNVQDDVARAIRRGAIRILNELNGIHDSGAF